MENGFRVNVLLLLKNEFKSHEKGDFGDRYIYCQNPKGEETKLKVDFRLKREDWYLSILLLEKTELQHNESKVGSSLIFFIFFVT